MAFPWHADDGPTLNAGLVCDFTVDSDPYCLEPYIFVFFFFGGGGGLGGQGAGVGGHDPLFPPLDPLTGLENSTRPLVLMSASGCRASENFDISSEN